MSGSPAPRRFFPGKAVVAVAASVVCVPLLLLVVELAAAVLVRRSAPEVQTWLEEDRRIRANNLQKSFSQWHYLAEAPPLWRSRGLRIPLTKPAGRRRIVVAGDSFVWGEGHANINDVWWRQLERELHRRGYDVDVAALGLSGFSTSQELDAVRRLLPYGKPDLLVWGFVTNDPDEGVVKLQAINRSGPFWRAGNALSRVFPFIVRGLTSDSYPRWENALVRSPNIDRYAGTVAGVARLLAEQRLPSFVVTLPLGPHMPPVDRSVSSLFRRAGIDWVETIEPFRQRMPIPTTAAEAARWSVSPVNGHPCARAMHFYAVVAADEAERRFASALGPRSVPRPRPAAINDWMPANMRLQQQGNGVTLIWPDQALMPTMPLGAPHVELSLAEAVPLRRVVVSGPSLDRVHLYATIENDEGFDDGRIVDLGEQRGGRLVWSETLPSHRINTLRLVAAFSGADGRMSVELAGAGG